MAAVGDAAALPRHEGTMRWQALGRDVETWYQVVGDLEADGPTPLLCVHGGPGATHDYLLAMADLAGDGRAVVFYDQVGNGRSSHAPDVDPASWTVELFRDELGRLVRHLGLHERGFHLLGQSWGGMLAPEYACDGPDVGLRTLTICDSPASIELWLQAAAVLRGRLDPDVQEALQRNEDAGTTDSPEYRTAMKAFYDRHVCRVVPNPPEVAATDAAIESDPTVYMAMNGPSEFHVIGSLLGWSIIDRLHRIPVPTLVVAGEHDEARPETWQPFVELVPEVRSHVVPGASHMPHVEAPAQFLDVVGGFLREHDPRA